MAQEYLNLEEAAEALGISREELIQKAQRREIRAFADRGSWKFRKQDVEEHARRAGIGSGAEIVFSDQESDQGSSDQILISDELGQESGGAAGARVVGMASDGTTPSDSDVRLVPEDEAPGLQPAEPSGPSDSDVQVAESKKPPSDSDVKLVPESEEALSDSDVKVAGPAPSDSDVRLDEVKAPSDSGVKLSGDSSAPSAASEVTQDLPVLPDELEDSDELLAMPGSSAEVAPTAELDSDFELDLDAGDSSDEVGLLPDEDQVRLAPQSPSESDVTGQAPSSSGISLASPADSGIALETGPTGPAAAAADLDQPTEHEPADEGDSDFELSPESASDTAQLTMDSDFDLSDSDFDVGTAEDSGQVLALSDEEADDSAETRMGDSSSDSGQVLTLEGEEEVDEAASTRLAAGAAEEEWGEELEEVGDFEEVAEAIPGEEEEEALEAAEEVEAEAVPAAAPQLARVAAAQPQWGAGWVVTLGFSSVLMLFIAVVMLDLVRTMWGWPEELNLYSSPILNALAKLWQ